MANPLYNALGGNMGRAFPGNTGKFGQLMQQFQRFKQTFQGDPKAEVEKLLQSGRINQQQLDMVQGLAQQFGQMLQ